MILNVLIACSAAFTRWLCGSIGFIMMLSYYRYFLNDLDATLSMMLKTGLNPLFVKYVMFSLKIVIVDASFEYFTDVSKVEFYDQSNSITFYVFSSIDLIGNFPVK